MSLLDPLLVTQMMSDEAPPVSVAVQTETTLVFTWRGPDEKLDVEITLDRRAHWHYINRKTKETWEHHQDADDGWPAEGKRYLMRFNRRVPVRW